MENAQKELIDHIADREVDFVSIAFRQKYSDEALRIKGSLNEVLPMLNFNYDSDFGGQELFGYIWYKDGTWSGRGEYGGSEWWQHQAVPDRNADVDA